MTSSRPVGIGRGRVVRIRTEGMNKKHLCDTRERGMNTMFDIAMKVGDNYETIGHAPTEAEARELAKEAMNLQKIDPSIKGAILVLNRGTASTIDEVYRDMQIAVNGEWIFESIEDYKELG